MNSSVNLQSVYRVLSLSVKHLSVSEITPKLFSIYVFVGKFCLIGGGGSSVNIDDPPPPSLEGQATPLHGEDDFYP